MSSQPGYRRGDRVALEHTADPHTRLRPGDEGTVTSYDPRLSQLNIRWDSGSTLAMLLLNGDQVRLLTPAPGQPPARTTPSAPPASTPAPEGDEPADQEITALYEMPGLAARQDYDRHSLAGDLGLARDDLGMAETADACPPAGRQEFWLEAARLARRRLHPGPGQRAGDGNPAGRAHPEPGPRAGKTRAEEEDDAEAEGAGLRQDITDRASGLSRLLSERCSTCILRSGDKMHLGPEQTAAFVRQALAEGTYVVCHQTLTHGDNPDFGPAICRGFYDAYASRSPALVLLRAFRRLTEVEPPRPGGPPG